MDSEIVRWAITVAVIPASIIIWKWWTESFLPARQKQTDEEEIHDRKTQGDALGTVLDLQRDVTKHLIDNDNGHWTTLTANINQGNKDHTLQMEKGFAAITIQMEKVIASVNGLLILLARAGADLPSLENLRDLTGISQIMSTAIKSEAVQETEKIVADAVKPESLSNEQPG